MLSAAAVPRSPFKPNRVAGFTFAVLAALGLGILAGLFRELQDDSLRRAEQARELAVPLLALVPQVPSGGGRS